MMRFIASIFLSLGFLAILFGILGTYRFQDAFTRNHAAGLIYNIGMILMLIGIACLQQNYVNSIKITFMIMLIMLFSPVSSHAIAKTIQICRKKKSDDGI